MATTYVDPRYHVVFSTKLREPSIPSDLKPRLHAYMAGSTQNLQGKSMRVGGTQDHVHKLFGLKATHSLSDVVREVKKSASSWMKC